MQNILLIAEAFFKVGDAKLLPLLGHTGELWNAGLDSASSQARLQALL